VVNLLTVGLAKPSPWEKRNGNIFGADGSFGGFVHNLSAKN